MDIIISGNELILNIVKNLDSEKISQMSEEELLNVIGRFLKQGECNDEI